MWNANNSSVAVIGAGFSGLTAAALLATRGNEVTVYEKNEQIGGRARTFEANGFLFDRGPSWYWMPDVYERYYNSQGFTTSDFYELKKLDPGFNVIVGNNECLSIPADFEQLCDLFEDIEKGSADKLKKFMLQAEYKYKVGLMNFAYKPGLSITEFFHFSLVKDAFQLQLFSSFSEHVRSYFKDPRLIALMEFPVLFLGAMPKDTPALYSLMNFAGLKQGTFYPMGGFGKVVDAFKKIAETAGVTFKTAEAIQQLELKSGIIHRIHSNSVNSKVNAVIAAADYHHVEQVLLPEAYRTYSTSYWDKKTFAPSSLIFYLGINKKLDRLAHHNLFFDEDFTTHAKEIYTTKKWPTKPLFYVCCPSKTDPSVAPAGCENLFLLMPIATGLQDSEEIRENYLTLLLERLSKYVGENISPSIVYKQSYCVADFISDYNAYKGNAYGLANTLLQTAIFKPKIRSKKVKNLFFSGQLTVPGPGVPPAIISGQISANELLNYLSTKK